MLPEFVSSHIIITHFDDIYGPQVLLNYPQLDSLTDDKVVSLITKLLDMQSNNLDWQFMYADQTFASQNIIFSQAKKKDLNIRSHILEFGISLILIPPNECVVKGLYGIWTYLAIIKDICSSYLYDMIHANLPIDELSKELEDIIHEINNQFNN